MSTEKTLTQTTVGCLALLFAIPVCMWIGAHTVHMAWHGILRVYVPALQDLTMWQAYAMGVAVAVFTHGMQFEFKEDDRPTKQWAGLGLVISYAIRWVLVWATIRYLVRGGV